MKKGVVATFVILGIVILTLVLTVYTFRSKILEATIGREVERAITVPPQAERVQLLIDNCIQEVGGEAIATIGAQGGYMIFPEETLPATPIYPFGNSLDLFGDKGIEVPFWFFESANGIQQNQIPTLQQIKTAIATYIDENLPVCINDFQTFKQQGYIITYEPPTTTVELGKQVVLDIVFPISITIQDFSFRFTNFRRSIASPLEELYTVAKELMAYENKEYFIENRVLDMMVVYDSIPFSGVDFECSPRSWTKTDVYRDLKQTIAANLPSIKIRGTKFAQGKTAKSFIIDALEKNHDLTATLRYEESWPLLMEVVGENGEILRGKPFTTENEASRFLLALFCLNDYHFVYNVKFPALITLEKDNTVFQFATQAIIQNNQARENRADLTIFETETPICDAPAKEMQVLVEGYRPNGFVQPLVDARVSYKCLNQVCEIGTTRLEGSNFALTKKFPLCFNGLVIAEREGFHRAEEVVSTNQEVTKVSLTLEPVKELAVLVKVIDEGNERALYASEQVLFTFENTEEKYITNIIYPDQKTVKLIAGDYKVTSSLIIENDKGFKLQEKEIEVCTDTPRKGVLGLAGLTKKQCTKQTIKGTTIKQIMVGGSSNTWFVERDSLLFAQEVTLYTARGPTPQSIDDITKAYETIREKEVARPVLR